MKYSILLTIMTCLLFSQSHSMQQDKKTQERAKIKDLFISLLSIKQRCAWCNTSKALIYCNECKIFSFCTKEHQNADLDAGHNKICKKDTNKNLCYKPEKKTEIINYISAPLENKNNDLDPKDVIRNRVKRMLLHQPHLTKHFMFDFQNLHIIPTLNEINTIVNVTYQAFENKKLLEQGDKALEKIVYESFNFN